MQRSFRPALHVVTVPVTVPVTVVTVVAVVVTAVWFGAAPAAAAPAAPAAGVGAHADADRLFRLGMFREAAATYQRAYLARPAPELLFDLGQCYRHLDSPEELERAIFYFESYLKNAPGTSRRAEVESQIARLRREISARHAALARPPIHKRWWFWTIIGVVVTGAAVGTAVALRPQSQQPVEGTLATLQLALRRKP